MAKLKRLIVFYTVTAISWLLLNMYWFYPYIKSYQATFGQRFDVAWGTAGAVSWSQSISVNTSWLNLFRLRGITDWYTNTGHPYAEKFLTNPLLIFLNIFLVTFALFGIWEIKKLKGLLSKSRVIFLTLLLIAIPLAATSHSPLGIIYDYLLVNLPGFTLFRSGYFKFGVIIWFAYAYLVATGAGLFTKVVSSRFFPKNKSKVALIVTTATIGSILIYNYPIFSGSFFNYSSGRSTMIQIPDYIFEAQKELNKNNFSTRTLFLPNSDIRTEYIEYDWNYFSLVELPQSMGRGSTIFNGVSAWQNEKDLIIGALIEYVQFGRSNLIKFTGTDRAVVQNDFISPDYEGNPLSTIKEEFKKSSDFDFDKSIGRWNFYKYNKNSVPRIYSPSKVTFVSSDPQDLYLIANIPDALGDGFVWSHFSDGIENELYDKAVFQAECLDCPSEVAYNIFFTNSKVMIPGNIFYELGEIITNVKESLAGSPEAKINMNLDTSAILISDLGSLQAKNDQKGVKVAVEALIRNIDQIKNNYNEIQDRNARKEFDQKIIYFLNFFLSYESQWVAAATNESIKSDLIRLESELKNTVSILSTDQNNYNVSQDDLYTDFAFDTPQHGIYDIYIYSPDLPNETLELDVNSIGFIAERLDDNWFRATSVPVKDSQVLIKVSGNIDEISAVFALIELDDVHLDPPKIEFMALNQTKYLVRTRGGGKFILGFNSRFDPNWSLRELDSDSDKYFSGETKEYFGYGVTEFKRNDKHVFSDFVMRNKSPKIHPDLVLNSISNGWKVDLGSVDESDDQIFLLEYQNQNDFYYASAVSFVSLVSIISFYYFRYVRKKSK